MLPPPQLKLWPELGATPESFTLYGGTALTLRLGHRTSVDFYFFSNAPLDPERLASTLPYLKDAERVQIAPDTLTCRVDRGGAVLVSFFGGLGLGQVAERDEVKGIALHVASLLDIAGTKMAVVQNRRAAAAWRRSAHGLGGGERRLRTQFQSAHHAQGDRFFRRCADALPRRERTPQRRRRSRRYYQTARIDGLRAARGKWSEAMKPLPATSELLSVAERVVWFKAPSEALADPMHFLAHVMTYGTVEDLRALQGLVGQREFRETLEHAPPGIFDPRSWAYWNLKCGRAPTPPLPVRHGVQPILPRV